MTEATGPERPSRRKRAALRVKRMMREALADAGRRNADRATRLAERRAAPPGRRGGRTATRKDATLFERAVVRKMTEAGLAQIKADADADRGTLGLVERALLELRTDLAARGALDLLEPEKLADLRAKAEDGAALTTAERAAFEFMALQVEQARLRSKWPDGFPRKRRDLVEALARSLGVAVHTLVRDLLK